MASKSQLRKIARAKASKYGLDPSVFERQINQESGFNTRARSPAGAQGIAQIMPGTAKGWHVNPNDPVAALDAAAKNMASYVKKYGSYKNALVAYNAGPGAVGGHLPAETQNYIKTILHGSNPSTQSVDHGDGGSAAHSVQSEEMQQSALGALWAKNHPGSLLTQIGAFDRPTDRATDTSPHGGTTVEASETSHVSGITKFDGKPVAKWIASELEWAKQHGWKGTVNSGYRSDAEQKRIYDSGVRPAAKPRSEGGGGSNHSLTGYLQGAVDVSDAAVLSRLLKRKHSKLKWAGAKDPVHFSVPHGGSY